MDTAASKDRAPSAPWWRVGIVWLVIGSTVAVAAAGIGMVRVARTGADVAVIQPPSNGSTMPAMQGRNHAATPPAEGPRSRP